MGWQCMRRVEYLLYWILPQPHVIRNRVTREAWKYRMVSGRSMDKAVAKIAAVFRWLSEFPGMTSAAWFRMAS